METSHAKDILPQNKPSEDALENTIVPASDTVVKPEPDTAQDAVIQTPPELSERYTFVRELGRGTQGHVYEAIRLQDQQRVAIKKLNIDSIQTWKEYDLFMREAETLKALQLPGIAHFYEALEFLDIEHPAAYIVQEYIAGRSLSEMNASGYRFSMQRVFEVAERLIRILKELHHHDPPIIHRDIKPSNVLFMPTKQGDNFELFLIDFGAVANPQIQSGGSTVAGTFGYMPPEQLMGKPGPASDIYALGAMLAYMLSGVEPAAMQVSDFRLIIEPHLESVPQPVVATIRQMLAPNINDRICDHDKLIRLFHQYQSNIFENNLPESSRRRLSELSVKLKKVKAYGQIGNIELWDMLSEQTPRDIPEVYVKLNTNALPDMHSFNDVVYNLLSPIFQATFKRTFNAALIMIACSTLVFITLFYLISEKQIVELLGIIVFVFFFEFLGFYSLFASFGWLPKTKLKLYKLKEKEYSDKVAPLSKQHNKKLALYQKVFAFGKKTVATIVDISYKSVNNKTIEAYHFTQIEELNKKYGTPTPTEVESYYCHEKAAFKIRYKFNPPDDSSPLDLVHEIITYTDCEDTLKPGDLIPILYYINPDDNREVFSTPFPVPFSDFINYDNLMGHSKDIL